MEASIFAEDTMHANKPNPVIETNTSIATNIAKYEMLVSKSQTELDDLTDAIKAAEDLAKKAGLSARSGLKDTVDQFRDGTATLSSTGGHSNTDHVVITTGDYVTDRIAELRRTLLNRCREAVPESRGDDRWDKPKALGERRRRIVRAKDLPEAPPEPPPSAYIIYLSQMTAKMRHDRPNEPHRQPVVMREVSKLWTVVLSDVERTFYTDFCKQMQEEHKLQSLEFRATGSYTPSERFERPNGANLWMHKRPEERNDLECELSTYETLVFPIRPPEMDAAYEKREKESRERRKLKLRMEAAERRRRKNLPPIVPRKRRKKRNTNEDTTTTAESGETGADSTSVEQETEVDDFLSGIQMMEAATKDQSVFDPTAPQKSNLKDDDEAQELNTKVKGKEDDETGDTEKFTNLLNASNVTEI